MSNLEESLLEKEALALRSMDDSEIDTSDIPEILNFSKEGRGRFYRPVKQSVTLRLDADLLDWFRRHNDKYQTAINKVLREYVESRTNA